MIFKNITFLIAFLCLLLSPTISDASHSDEKNPETDKKTISKSASTNFMDFTRFYVSSNTQATVGVFDITDSGTTMSSFSNFSADSDGIFYDEDADVIYQLDRVHNTVNAYDNVSVALEMGNAPTVSASSPSNFSNGREIAVSGNRLVVAQDADGSNGNQNEFYIYDISPTSITFVQNYIADINLWGIFAVSNSLYAVEDNSNRIVFYEDFFDHPTGMVLPDQIITIENLIRTHGLTYDEESDLMILTDVGEASSAGDGALVVIKNFTTASADGTVSANEQIRVSGGSSNLGNPVDVAYDKENNKIYVAERANGGGRVLGFNFPVLSGGIAPFYNVLFPGASAIHLPGLEVGTCDFVDGGTVSLENGGTETTIFVDGNPDMISFSSDIDAVANNHSFTYVVTDADGMILGIPGGNTVDFDPAGLGACLVYGLSYTGDLNIMMGDDLLENGLQISDDCFDLSDNWLTVNRISPEMPDTRFYVSSNLESTVGVYGILDNGTIVMNSFNVDAMDADGIYYDEDADVIYQLNRTDNVINAYSNVSDSMAVGADPLLTATSSSDFSNGREIAFVDGKIVVAQDAATSNGDMNQFYIYDATPTSITLDKVLDVDINLWGIHANGSTLYAVEDNSNRIAVYNNFFDNPMGSVSADMIVSVDNLVRTHGITYDAEDDILFLTDVGEASSATDGALVVVKSFTSVSADGTISMNEQIRVSGASSALGNPVDVAYDKGNNKIYVAERANGGGRVLGFNFPALSGGVSPFYNQLFAGASAIHLPGLEVGLCDFVDGGNVTLENGGTTTTIFVDGIADMISFSSNIDAAANGHSFTYVVTDADGIILGIPGGNTVDFDPAGLGACLVYGLSYTGTLNIMMGDDLLENGLQISDDCFDLSDNWLTVNRITPEMPENSFFVSSNTQSRVGVYGILDNGSIVMNSFNVGPMDADGIYYDEDADVIYQLNRIDNVINAYSNVSDSLATGGDPLLTATSSSDFSNGREIAFVEGKIVVAQDAATSNGDMNQFYIYDATPTSITLDKVLDVDINLWGIFANGKTLYAIEDNSNRLAIYNNFFDNPMGSVTADMIVDVDNLVRTHGITYDAEDDILFLTDVGEASSATDGALVVVKSFTSVSADGTISMSEQIRVAGGASGLGNPVDIAYDKENEKVYVAERANGGGRVLGFDFPILSGGISPFYNQLFAGASAIHLPGLEVGFCDFVDGGTVALENGGTETTIIIDGNPDMISFSSNIDPVASGHSFTYVVTDADGMILGIPGGNTVDFDPAGLGACLVYGLSYTGTLNIMMGDDLLENGLVISDDCFDLSDNWLTVNRIAPEAPNDRFYVSSNTQASVGVYDILTDGTVVMDAFGVVAGDADGIFYDEGADVLYQLNRTDNVINAYSNVSDSLAVGSDPLLTATSSSDFANGREIAVSGGKLIVAQDAAPANSDMNQLYVYDITPTSITLDKVFDVDINLWGIHLTSNNLYAVEDNSNRLAIYPNIFAEPAGSLSPGALVSVDNLVRTHGLTYDSAEDLMILTDVGEASSATDGAIVVIKNFTAARANSNISITEQIRVAGGTSNLGNPVDVAYDKDANRIYVAERANGGGRVLGFNFPTLSGGIAPVYNQLFAGASAIHFPDADVDDFNEDIAESRNTLVTPTVTSSIVLDKLYPVPTTDELNLSIESTLEQETTFVIYNMQGVVIATKEVALVKGMNTINFNVSQLSNGYHLISNPTTGFTAKFLKVLR